MAAVREREVWGEGRWGVGSVRKREVGSGESVGRREVGSGESVGGKNPQYK